jgi:hypothetical protein
MHKIVPSGHTGGTRQAQRTVTQEESCSVVLRKQQGGACHGGSCGQDRTTDLSGDVPDCFGSLGTGSRRKGRSGGSLSPTQRNAEDHAGPAA